jgi:hypothetical protein
MTDHTGGVSAVASTVLDDRPIAVTAGLDRTVRIWDLTTRTPIGDPLTGHTDAVRAVACTVLDNRPIAVTAGLDRTVRIWDLTTRTPIGDPPTGHTDRVNAVACTVLDGRPVAITTSWDHTVRIWDLTTRTPIGDPPTGHTDRVTAVTCTVLHDRPVAVTTSNDGTVRIWDLQERRELDRIDLPASQERALSRAGGRHRVPAACPAHLRAVRWAVGTEGFRGASASFGARRRGWLSISFGADADAAEARRFVPDGVWRCAAIRAWWRCTRSRRGWRAMRRWWRSTNRANKPSSGATAAVSSAHVWVFIASPVGRLAIG